MSTNGVNQKTSFWRRLHFIQFGNWMKSNGAKLGNVMSATGQAATNVAMGGIMMHAMNKNSSIFGFGCGYGGGGFGCGCGGGFGYGTGMMPSLGGWYGGDMYSSMYGQTDPMLQQYGLTAAYQYGQNLMAQAMYNQRLQQQQLAQQYTTTSQQVVEQKTLEYRDNESAEAIIGGSTEAGKAFDGQTDKLAAGKQEKISITIQNGKYAENMGDLAKSYLANIDSDNDGYISEEEFVEHETSKLDDDVDADTAEQMAKNAFAKLDRNHDNHIDYKEFGSLFVVMDGTQKDGVINKSTYQSVSDKLADGNNTTFVKDLDTAYNKYFKPKDDDE